MGGSVFHRKQLRGYMQPCYLGAFSLRRRRYLQIRDQQKRQCGVPGGVTPEMGSNGDRLQHHLDD